MKSLSLTKPLVLMVIGIPGAGKSFFARQFSDTFGAPLVSYDILRTELYAEEPYDKQQVEIVSKIANIQFSELLKTKKTIIVDGLGNTRKERLDIRKTASDAGYDTLIVWVQTDNATAEYRSLKRSKRRKDDEFNVSLSHEQFTALEKRFTPPSDSDKYIVISGKHTYATQAKIVLKKLVAPRESSLASQDNLARRAVSSDTPARRGVIIR